MISTIALLFSFQIILVELLFSYRFLVFTMPAYTDNKNLVNHGKIDAG